MSPSYVYYRIFGYAATILMHVSNIIYMAKGIGADNKYRNDPEVQTFSEVQARFFTCWTFFLQIAYAFTALTCDLLILSNSKENYRLTKYLKGFRETLFGGILFPSTFLVFSVFWTIYLYDRTLIFPEFVDKVLSTTSNHVIHTAIVPVVLWEVWFQPRNVPKSHSRNLKHLTFHMLLYLSVLFYTYVERGVWLYPIFKIIHGTIYMPLLLILLGILVVMFYFMHWVLVSCLWGSAEKHMKKKR